jgi:hypothetical protein
MITIRRSGSRPCSLDAASAPSSPPAAIAACAKLTSGACQVGCVVAGLGRRPGLLKLLVGDDSR